MPKEKAAKFRKFLRKMLIDKVGVAVTKLAMPCDEACEVGMKDCCKEHDSAGVAIATLDSAASASKVKAMLDYRIVGKAIKTMEIHVDLVTELEKKSVNWELLDMCESYLSN